MATLAAEIETIKGKLTDQSHVMQDVSYHFSNLWFAGQHENWDLANFYASETKSHLHWAVRVIPVRKDNAGREVDLLPILQGMENGAAQGIAGCDCEARQINVRNGVSTDDGGLLRLSQGGGQAVSAAADSEPAGIADHQLRPAGRLAPMSLHRELGVFGATMMGMHCVGVCQAG